MATPIIMPKAGVAMESGTIIQWLKEPGDKVETGEIILEIETDKVSMEVEAETSGYFLGAIAGLGEEVAVTLTIGYLGEKGESMPVVADTVQKQNFQNEALHDTSPPELNLPQPVGKTPTIQPDDTQAADDRLSADGIAGQSHPIPATPAAVRVAREQGVFLKDVAGQSGNMDTVLHKKDVEDYLAALSHTDTHTNKGSSSPRMSSLARRELSRQGLAVGEAATAIDGSGSAGRILRSDVAHQYSGLLHILQGLNGFVPPGDVPAVSEEGDTRLDLRGIRKVTAQRMTTSHLIIPPTTLNREVRAGKLVKLRSELQENGIGVSVNTLILMATARALRECDWMRLSLQEGTIIQRNSVHLGMAVASEKGLLVPVIHNADRLDMNALSRRAGELASKAREGKLSMEEMTGGVFSVSNLGMYGITTFTPIVNPPEAGILGVGTIRQLLEKSDAGEIIESQVMDMSLTLDHRVIDGAQGALFLQKLAEYIETPLRFLSSS